MFSLAVLVHTPLLDQAIELRETHAWILDDDHADGFTDGLYIAFDFAFVLRMTDPCRIDETAIVLAHLAIGSVEMGVVKITLDDATLEIIDDSAIGDPAKELEHTNMRVDEAYLVLAEGEFHILHATVGECCNERIEGAAMITGGIEHHAHASVIDLYFATRFGLKAAGGPLRVNGELVRADESLIGSVADLAGEIMALTNDGEGALGLEREVRIVDQGCNLFEIGQEGSLYIGDAAQAPVDVLKQSESLLFWREGQIGREPEGDGETLTASNGLAVVA